MKRVSGLKVTQHIYFVFQVWINTFTCLILILHTDELKDVTVTNHQTEEVKDLSRSKWSNDLDAEEEGEKNKNNGGALSGLVQAYSSKEAKSVCWGDQVCVVLIIHMLR